jgi:sec-independent protein translocase protein TatA
MVANMFGADGLIVLLVAVVVLFGGSQLPKLAKNVGSAGREFRKAQAEAEAHHAQTEVAATALAPNPGLPVAAPRENLMADGSMIVSRSELK